MAKGIVLLGHGSRARVDEANLHLLEMVAVFKEKTGIEKVVPAWMNSKSGRPGLKEAAGELAEAGCKEIIVAPWFLTDGLHIREDIPAIIAELEQQYPDIRFALAKPMGADPRLAEIILDRIREVS